MISDPIDMEYSVRKIRRISEQSDGVDRISELPDPILCNILSYLPTKHAIATSILSKRWNTLFPFWFPPIRLDLDYNFFLYPDTDTTPQRSLPDMFADFVDKLLNKTQFDASCLEVVDLNCVDYCWLTNHEINVVSWVSSALRLNVRELLLTVRLDQQERALFENLNGCTTLTRLDLGERFHLYLPIKFTLPNLKVLYLYKLWADNFNELIRGCPLLEDLEVNECDLEYVDDLYIRSSVLKYLTLKDSVYTSKYDLLIDAPNLEELNYSDANAKILSVSNFSRLRIARIDVYYNEKLDEFDEERYFSGGYEDDDWRDSSSEGVLKFVTACSGAVELYLSDSSFSSLSYETSLNLPTFMDLTWLRLGKISYCDYGWPLLAQLLCNAPNFRKLTIEEQGVSLIQEFSTFESSLPSPPFCLEHRLKEIEFWVFEENESEIKLIEYFFKYGKVIERLELCCLPCKKANTWSRLRMLPWKSKIDFRPRKKIAAGQFT